MKMQEQQPAQSYLSMHSPRGACAHFALGQANRGGGFGLQSKRAANQDVFIGVRRGTKSLCLPFFENAYASESIDLLAGKAKLNVNHVFTIPDSIIRRTFGWGSDTWLVENTSQTGCGLSFTIYTPVGDLPDPLKARPEAWKNAITPALAARLVVDNRGSSEPLEGFFSVGGLCGLHSLAQETAGELCGWVTEQGYGFACRAADYPNARTAAYKDLPDMFKPGYPVPLGRQIQGVLLIDVAPGEVVTLDFALGWYLGGIVTDGERKCSYAYTNFFGSTADVLRYAVNHLSDWRADAEKVDRELVQSKLNADQQFMLAMATRSYYASTALFDDSGSPRWVVNEGSYMMMNTLDLQVDHIFFELRQHPWVVKNVLDSFVELYSHYDQVHFPEQVENLFPGGLSFTHDQGCDNIFFPRGTSSYEPVYDPVLHPESFAHMTQEQLVNWILCAGLYVHKCQDKDWAVQRRGVISDCLKSMLNRDHPDPEQRDGIMDLDSYRAGSYGEICTYDSVDQSLSQARRNLYLAVKCWASYLTLEYLLEILGELALAHEARQGADRCAATICAAFDSNLGFIPAILNSIDKSPIIPAVEGLIYPSQMGLEKYVTEDGPYGEFITKLRQHLINVLQPGLCLFPDGSWKLSAHSDNSWISKIFLCQYIARKILKVNFGADQLRQDRLHADWWRVGCASCPGIDQIIAGKTDENGWYYPRGVTASLWLEESISSHDPAN